MERVDLGQYAWIHFEGRAIGETRRMMERVGVARAARGLALRVSVELERGLPDIDALLPLADVVRFAMRCVLLLASPACLC